MGGIIVALPKTDDAKNICAILKKYGIDVSIVCSTGAEILSAANRYERSIVICTKRFSDMYYIQIKDYLPKGSEMLLLASQNTIETCPSEIMTLKMPFRSIDLITTVETMINNQRKCQKKTKSQPKKRNEIEQNYINNAKMILMDKNNMTEQEAFRYIQKCSMDSGTNMVEMAQMIISIRCV